MLVFQKDWKNHIEDYGCTRAKVSFTWLVEAVAEINRYLPDDWRLTRSTNNFRIEIVSDQSVILVGFGYRLKDGKILNIIDSVHPKGFVDIVDLNHHQQGGKKLRLGASTKRSLPETLTPNLYFFRPCPDDSDSPLFARQYERVKKGKNGEFVGNQFHRIHPLTRAGLDLTHFRWVLWTISGDVSPVEAPYPEYHGKDFWEIKPIAAEKLRGSPEKYLTEYDAILKHCNIQPSPLRQKYPSPYEIEYKLLAPGSAENAHVVFNIVPEAIKEFGLTIADQDKRAVPQEDTYFDDENHKLLAADASFRLRKKKGHIRITLKKRFPSHKGYSEEGQYKRIEEESVITSFQEAELMAGRSVNVFPYRLLPYIVPESGALKPVLQVNNDRKTLVVQDAGMQKAEVCLDKNTFQSGGNTYGPCFEIEVESKGMPIDDVRRLSEYLEKTLGLIPSRQSKYERGMSLAKTSQIPQGVRNVIIDTDCGVDDALALILALKSPELHVEAITTVSGNVHIDKVIPNVFKVLNALGLKNPPMVAKGADRPLKKTPIIAESVHGEDGLGDAPQYSASGKICKEPAWKLICRLAREQPKAITLITIGPLTNLALAIQQDPEGVGLLKEVVVMGGVFFNIGNVRPDAEFNVAADPDAAFEVVRFCRDSCRKIPVDAKNDPVVLPNNPTDADCDRIKNYRSPDPKDPGVLPLTFVGLDVTHRVLLRRSTLLKSIDAHPGNDLLKFIRDISAKYMDFYNRNEGLPGCYLHDPLAVGYAINPSFLDIEKHIIQVETADSVTNGVIFPDDRPTRNPLWRNPADEVIGVARRVEVEAFEEFFLSRLIYG